MTRLLCCVLLVSGLSASIPARAQDEPAPGFDDEEARGLFDAGRAAFQAGRFEDALGYFERAHELSNRPLLLFNIGSSLDRLRRDTEALETFGRYLAEVPDAVNRQEVEARIRILREALAEPEALDTTPAAQVDAGAAPDDADEDVGATSGGGGGRLWTWVAAATAVALGGAAVGLWLAGNTEYDDLETACGFSGCSEDQLGTLKTFDTLATASLVGAIAAGAGAIVLFVVEGGSNEPEVEVGLRPTGALVRGSF